jgi:hypothetical protein
MEWRTILFSGCTPIVCRSPNLDFVKIYDEALAAPVVIPSLYLPMASATLIPLANAASTVPAEIPSCIASPAKYKVSSTGVYKNFLAAGVATIG